MRFEDRFYTFINQIFGDVNVRQIYMEVHPHDTYALDTEKDEEHGFHHIAYNIKTGEKICSKQSRLQHTRVDIHDVLCQSYSLYVVFSKTPLTKDKVQKQLDIINMYRTILRDHQFIDALTDDILTNPDNEGLWKMFRSGEPTDQNICMKKNVLLKNIHRLLNEWEQYGYNYFIGRGQYDSHNKI